MSREVVERVSSNNLHPAGPLYIGQTEGSAAYQVIGLGQSFRHAKYAGSRRGAGKGAECIA